MPSDAGQPRPAWPMRRRHGQRGDATRDAGSSVRPGGGEQEPAQGGQARPRSRIEPRETARGATASAQDCSYRRWYTVGRAALPAYLRRPSSVVAFPFTLEYVLARAVRTVVCDVSRSPMAMRLRATHGHMGRHAILAGPWCFVVLVVAWHAWCGPWNGHGNGEGQGTNRNTHMVPAWCTARTTAHVRCTR